MDNLTHTMHKIELPRELYQINPWAFIWRIAVFAILTALFIFLTLIVPPIFAVIPLFFLGIMYAHGVELQHNCLHGTAFRSKQINRIVGVIVGLPMLNSHSHYRSVHLKHHARLGTPEDEEFFYYDRFFLGSWGALLMRSYSMHRYRKVFRSMYRALTGKRIEDARNALEDRHIRQEYLVMIGVMVLVVALSISFRTPWLLILWIVPLFLSAESAHYLIELPEHIGCEPATTNVVENTRTIRGSWFSFWLTNGNNYHAEHHYAPGVPTDKLEQLHNILSPYLKYETDTYWGFYSSVVQQWDERYREYQLFMQRKINQHRATAAQQ